MVYIMYIYIGGHYICRISHDSRIVVSTDASHLSGRQHQTRVRFPAIVLVRYLVLLLLLLCSFQGPEVGLLRLLLVSYLAAVAAQE